MDDFIKPANMRSYIKCCDPMLPEFAEFLSDYADAILALRKEAP